MSRFGYRLGTDGRRRRDLGARFESKYAFEQEASMTLAATAQRQGERNPDYPFAVVAHPIGSLTPAELRTRAAVALPQVIAILAGAA